MKVPGPVFTLLMGKDQIHSSVPKHVEALFEKIRVLTGGRYPKEQFEDSKTTALNSMAALVASLETPPEQKEVSPTTC